MAPHNTSSSSHTAGISRRSLLTAAAIGMFGGFTGVTSGDAGFGDEIDLADAPWPSYRYDSTNSGAATDITLSPSPTSTWSRSIDDPRETETVFTSALSSPVRSHRLILYTTDQAIVARGSGDGSLIWRKENADSCSVSAVPTVASDTVITADETVTAWDIDTGAKRWETDLSPISVEAPLKADSETVYVGASQGLGGAIHALDAETGESKWTATMDSRISSEVAVGDNAVYAVDDGGLFKRIENGQTIWEIDLDGINFRTLDGHEFFSPILVDDAVIVPQIYTPSGKDGEKYGGVFVFDSKDGSLISSDTELQDIDVTPTAYADTVVIGDSAGQLRGGDVFSTYDEWNSGLDHEITTALSVVDNTLIYGTQSGAIIGINPESGEQLWSHNVLSEPITGVIAGHSAIYATGKSNTIGGIHIENSIEARIELQELLNLFSTATEYGMTSAAGRSELSEAARAITNGNYETALNAARAGKDALGEDVSEIETIQEKITSARQEAIQLGNETPASTTDILTTLDEAATALRDQDTQQARQLTERSQSRVNALKSGYENATREIGALSDSISSAQNQSVPIYNSSDALNSSQTALKSGEFETAASMANSSRSDLESRIQTIETYRNHKQRADELFDTIAKDVGPLVEEQQQYEQAVSSFESEQFEAAAEQMEATVTNLETILDHIETYQEHKNEFERHDEEATTDDIILTAAKNSYQKAGANFEVGDYAAAAEQMSKASKQASDTIATARQARKVIAAAEDFSPIQPFVKAVARQFGSDQHLSAAKTAAAAGEYSQAKTKAAQARSAQRSARAVISGGIGASAVSIYGIHRYDGIDKMADYLVGSGS